MKIAICGSMSFTEKMLEVKGQIEKLGHEAFVTKFTQKYAGKDEEEKQKLVIEDKNENDAIREFIEKILECDAVLVLNYDKKGIENYIGGNTFLEIGFAHFYKKKIFFLNPIPKIDFFESELVAIKPIVLNGDLSKIG